jgi:DNA-binding NarL/FixJ family response regulator
MEEIRRGRMPASSNQNIEVETMAHRPDSNPASTLTTREQEIAALVCRGLANREIAEKLDISPWTVAAHLRQVYSRLGVTSRTQMAAAVLLGAGLPGGGRRVLQVGSDGKDVLMC